MLCTQILSTSTIVYYISDDFFQMHPRSIKFFFFFFKMTRPPPRSPLFPPPPLSRPPPPRGWGAGAAEPRQPRRDEFSVCGIDRAQVPAAGRESGVRGRAVVIGGEHLAPAGQAITLRERCGPGEQGGGGPGEAAGGRERGGVGKRGELGGGPVN